MAHPLQRTALAAGFAAIVTLTGAAQTNGTPERFTAMAVNMGAPGRAGAGTVEIVVNRWSSDAERQRLMHVLMDQGADKLLDTLQKLPRVGYFRTPESLGYDLHYAHRTPLPDGGERVVLVTDRRIGFWEAANQARTLDYPFTMIELHMNKDGEGEGKLSLATKIIADKENGIVTLENYASQPVLLTSVKQERKSQ
jgi:hypothetical protein